MIYAGCKVKIGYIFSSSNVEKLNTGDKIVSKLSIEDEDGNTVEEQVFSKKN